MTDTKQSRGFAGAVLKLLRAGDYELTVTGRTQISPHYLRLSFAAGGLLEERSLHPTQWIRMWFSDGDKLHQRGYTLVNPDRAADTVDIDREIVAGTVEIVATRRSCLIDMSNGNKSVAYGYNVATS